MIPLPVSISIADIPISCRNCAGGDKRPTERLVRPTERRGVDGQTHEDIAHAVYGKKAIDELSVGRGDWCCPFEEGEGVGGSQDSVDAKAYEYGGEGMRCQVKSCE